MTSSGSRLTIRGALASRIPALRAPAIPVLAWRTYRMRERYGLRTPLQRLAVGTTVIYDDYLEMFIRLPENGIECLADISCHVISGQDDTYGRRNFMHTVTDEHIYKM